MSGAIPLEAFDRQPREAAPPPDGPDVYGVPSALDENTHEASELVLPVISASSLAGKPVPARRWHVPGMIPDRTVTLLGGDGSVGKSILAEQLGVATAAGKPWLGTSPPCGPVVYLSAEDDLDEQHRQVPLVGIVLFFGGMKLSNAGLERGPFCLMVGGWTIAVIGGVLSLLSALPYILSLI